MHTIDSSCRRRGISTIIGVIIFVGIMFTSVIPMFLVMNQADTLHEIRKIEVGRLDEEHAMENIFFHLETSLDPVTEEPIITLILYNRCELAIRIIHVWINSELREVNFLIPQTSDGSFELRDFVDPETPVPETFFVKVVTDMGNIFLPPSGLPEYSYDPILGGGWEHDVYTIYIMMTDPRPQLHLWITFLDPDPEGEDIIIVNEDLENNQDGYWRGVPYAGDYIIVVTQFHDTILFDGTRTVGPYNQAVLVII